VSHAALAALATALGAIPAPTASASNGAAPIAISGRAAGRGGADTAISDDAISGVHHNPAGMLNGSGNLRIDLQNMFTYTATRYVDARNDLSESGLSALAPGFGVAIDPFWGEKVSVPIRIGFGVAGHYGTSGDSSIKTEVYPEGVEESLDFALVKMGPTIAVSPIDGLRLGFGLFYNYFTFATSSSTSSDSGSTQGVLRDWSSGTPVPVSDGQGGVVTWNDLFAVAGSGSSTASLYDFDESTTSGVSFNLGIQYDVNDFLTVALAYTSPTWWIGDIEGDGEIDASRSFENLQSDPDVGAIVGPVLAQYLPGGNNAQFKSKYKYQLTGLTPPQIISLGLAVRPIDELQIALDGRWMQWTTMFQKIDADLSGGTSADINEIFGSDKITTGTEPDWSDMWVFGIGASVAPIDWLTLRLGYNYSTNPYPDNRIGPGTTPFLQHHITAGASFRFNDNWSATFGIVYAIREEKEIDVHETTPDYSNSQLAAEQLFIYLGVALDL